MKGNVELEERDGFYDSGNREDGEEGKGKGEAAYKREEVAAEFNGKKRN